jgi:multisubunit Na+/H+ antiporter MnhG subunit
MADERLPPAWQGFALDALLIISLSVLAALKVVPLLVFLALVGPVVGARLASAKSMSGGALAGGSTVIALVLGAWAIGRRVFGGA